MALLQGAHTVGINDMEEWLKSNDLAALVPTFKEHGLKLSDLMCSTEDDIRDICKELDISAVLRLRFIAAIKRTPGSAASEAQRIIFLGNEEKEVLQKLYKTNETISHDMNTLQTAINSLRKSGTECNALIHEKVKEMTSIIENEKDILLQRVDAMKQRSLSKLEARLNALTKINESTIKTKNECKRIAASSHVSSSLRLKKMQNAYCMHVDEAKLTDVQGDNVSANATVSDTKLTVTFDAKLLKQYFSHILDVKFDDVEFELKYEPECLDKFDLRTLL
eukprot:38743_1